MTKTVIRNRIDRGELLRAVNLAKLFVSTRNTLPILGGVHIVQKTNKITLTATDLDMSLSAEFASYGDDFETVVPHALLYKALTVMEDSTLELALHEWLTVKGSGSEFDVMLRDAQDFPVLPGLPQHEILINADFDAGELSDALNILCPFASKEETRSLLMGVQLEFHHKDGKETRCIGNATDTHRLARREISMRHVHEIRPCDIVIPASSLRAVIEAIKLTKPATVRVIANSSNTAFVWPGVQILTRMLDGTFPYTDKVVNPELTRSQHRFHIVVNRQSLLNVIKSGLKILPGIEKATAKIEPQRMQLFFGARGLGAHEFRFRSVVPDVKLTTSVQPPLYTASFNPRYLLSVAATCPGDWMEWRTEGPLNPGMFRPYNYRDKTPLPYPLYLLMPMQVADDDVWNPEP